MNGGQGEHMDVPTTFRTEKDALRIAAPRDRAAVEHWHADETCFGIRVMRARADGRTTRTWIARISHSNKSRRYQLGRTDRMTFSEAHLKALQLKDTVRRTGQVVPTFEEAWGSYRGRREKHWSEATLEGYKKRYEYIREAWGKRRVDMITPKDVAETHKKIIADIQKKNNGRERPYSHVTGETQALTVMRFAKIILDDVRKRDIISGTPFQQMIDDKDFELRNVKDRLIKANELPAFWGWLHGDNVLPVVRDYFLIEMFTGFRRSIMGSLDWKNIEHNPSGLTTYTLDKKKRGNKSRKTIAYPLCDLLVDRVIKPREGRRDPGTPWILPSPKRRGEPLVSVRGSFEAFRRETKIQISDHDMRRTIATVAHNLLGPVLASRVLTHSLTATPYQTMASTAGYIVTAPNDLKAGMDKVVAYILSIVEPKLGQKPVIMDVLQPSLEWNSDREAERDALEAERAELAALAT